MHIFAMKFRQMFNDLYSPKSADTFKTFGMVCSDGKGGVTEIGTGAEIIQRKVLPDGRLLLDVVGMQRFKVLRIVQEEPYIIAEVEYGVDDVDVPPSEAADDIPEDILQLEREVFQLVVDVVALSNRCVSYARQ
jgi:Lon protease-like protein